MIKKVLKKVIFLNRYIIFTSNAAADVLCDASYFGFEITADQSMTPRRALLPTFQAQIVTLLVSRNPSSSR